MANPPEADNLHESSVIGSESTHRPSSIFRKPPIPVSASTALRHCVQDNLTAILVTTRTGSLKLWRWFFGAGQELRGCRFLTSAAPPLGELMLKAAKLRKRPYTAFFGR